MRFLFLMDPAEKMLPDKDTTFAFMRGAAARGHECLHALPLDVYNLGRDVYATARSIRVSDSEPFVVLGPPETAELAVLDAVFIRKDPPFDLPYSHLTQQLDLVKDRTLIVNDPRGLRDFDAFPPFANFARLPPFGARAGFGSLGVGAGSGGGTRKASSREPRRLRGPASRDSSVAACSSRDSSSLSSLDFSA